MSDLISREAVIKAMENNSFTVEVFGTKRKMIDGMMMCVEIADLPTIEAAPEVQGEWENIGDDEEDLCFRCTNCKAEFSCEIDMRQFAKYCPECGAKMIGGAE